MPGGVPFSSVSCGDNPTTISIQTSYNGGPANQQLPMPYTDYVVAASSAAEASSNANSESSSSDTPGSNWVSHHEALLIGVIAAAIALLVAIFCIRVCFRRKKYTRARPAPVLYTAPPPRYQYDPNN